MTKFEKIPELRASSAGRYAACPGSWAAEQKIKLPETDNFDAERGRKIHAELAAYATAIKEVNDLPKLSDEAAILWGRMETSVIMLAAGATDYKIEDIETHYHGFGWSGHPDLLVSTGKTLHVIDYKTGWGDTPEAADNAQVRVYAVLSGWTDVYCHVVPLTAVTTTTHFDKQGVRLAQDEIAAILSECSDDNAQRCIGDHCRYCPAHGMGACPESQKLPVTADNALNSMVLDIKTMPAEQIGAALEMMEAVRRLQKSPAWEAVDAEAKRRLAIYPAAVPGWQLVDGDNRRTITDTGKAFLALAAYPENVVFSALNIQIAKLEKAVAKHKKIKVDEARTEIETVLAGLIKAKQNDPSLERIINHLPGERPGEIKK